MSVCSFSFFFLSFIHKGYRIITSSEYNLRFPHRTLMLTVDIQKRFRTQSGGKEAKVKQSHYRLDRPLRLQDFEAPRFLDNRQHEGGKVVSLTHRPPLPPRKFSWYLFLLEAESTPGPLCDRKDYVNEKFQ
jgi:hypothetical protein